MPLPHPLTTTIACMHALTDFGMSGDFFTSHAYFATPPAAARLLSSTRERCNKKKADYAIRLACLGSALDHCLRTRRQTSCDYRTLTRDASPAVLRCLRPSRLLWRRGLESVGLFAQDHLGITSYSALEKVHAIPGYNRSLFNRSLSRADGEARAALTALREHQCRRQLCRRGGPSVIRDFCQQ